MSLCFLLVGENPGNEVEKTANISRRREWFPRKGVGLFWSVIIIITKFLKLIGHQLWLLVDAREADQKMGTR